MVRNNKRASLKWIPHSSIEDRSRLDTSITWSLHELQINIGNCLHKTLVIDAGMFSWAKDVVSHNNTLPLNPTIIDSLLVTHTHNDHIGKIPVLVKEWYEGDIHMTQQSHTTFSDISVDSLRVQNSESEKIQNKRNSFGTRLNKLLSKESLTVSEKKLIEDYNIVKNSDIKKAQDRRYGLWEPLFTQEDLDKTLGKIESYPYSTNNNTNKFSVFNDTELIQARFLDAGHLYGSAMILIEIRKKNSKKVFNVLRWGDMGRFWNRIYGESPTLQGIKKQLDLVFLESTYWWKNHPDIDEEYQKRMEWTNSTLKRGGVVVHAEFAQNRLPQWVLSDLKSIKEWHYPQDTVIVIDSSLVKKLVITMSVTHPEYKEVLSSKHIRWTEKDQTEKLLLTQPKNHIFHLSWWMLQWWSILKVIKYFNKQGKDPITKKIIPKEYRGISQNGLVLLSGFTPEHTLWHVIRNNPEEYNSLSINLSGHIDHQGIIDFVTNKDWISGVELRKDAKICFMHGEIWAMYKLKDSLVEQWIDENNIVVPVLNGSEFVFPI